MALKGKTLWEVKKEIEEQYSLLDEVEKYIGVHHFALRADGTLLEKHQTKNLDGSTRYDYGWKLAQLSKRQKVNKVGGDEYLRRLKVHGYA